MGMCKNYFYLIIKTFYGIDADASMGNLFLPVNPVQGCLGHAFAHGIFMFRMDICFVSVITGYDHRNIRDLMSHAPLAVPEICPAGPV